MDYRLTLEFLMAVLIGGAMVFYALLVVGGRRFAGYALALFLISLAALFTTITAGAS
ncbi:hypothetical protein [Streptomyces sp. NBC_00198]|uniref:hypothetical protein n=1 Tax=Streptomyces sp. NBC_00198 TaxID=2975677 RepID=UPI00225050DA|nr:hypothetical protein [Streptomyces sp. NBC_00198]MCX5285935.1 hypothetical protein [Streptomyces sp. NBC_00198]MCX5286244.1 hypothetical protein [Streptomyces sp. NBC_00198]